MASIVYDYTALQLSPCVCSFQEPIVRQTAATALLELYSVPANMSPLHTFTDPLSDALCGAHL